MLAHIRPSINLLSLPLAAMAVVQLVFAFLSYFAFRDGVAICFYLPGLLVFLVAVIIHTLVERGDSRHIKPRTALLFTSLCWVCMGLAGAIPIMMVTHASFTDASFEAISALTTTGATVLSGLDELPKTFLMYRQFLQWLGGLGIVIFVVAVLPSLNVGGMKLLKAETPGPMKDDKLSPRIHNTAQYLWYVYVVTTVLCALSYWLAGMSAFDAVAHAFTTMLAEMTRSSTSCLLYLIATIR